MSTKPLELPELDWLAFRYVAGELDAADAEAFEQRLSGEQASRDAVADAMELWTHVECGLASRPVPATSASKRSSLLLAWMTAAALLVALVGGRFFTEPSVAPVPPELAGNASPSDAPSRQLDEDDVLGLWSDLESVSDPADPALISRRTYGDGSFTREEASPSDDLPGWMLTLVRYDDSLGAEPGADPPPVNEPRLERDALDRSSELAPLGREQSI